MTPKQKNMSFFLFYTNVVSEWLEYVIFQSKPPILLNKTGRI